jgi:predicted CXXCH cytochrome family protein
MKTSVLTRKKVSWVVFTSVFCLCMVLGGWIAMTTLAKASPQKLSKEQTLSYAGSESCAKCHQELYDTWFVTRHAHAFSAPIFQQDWAELGKQTSCLQCHTTGFNPTTGGFFEEGVTCESCHGPFQPNHPEEPMPFEPNADLCATCHKTTTDEWRASPHAATQIDCQSCHDPHSQTPKAATVTELCGNCHKERGDSFTHSTHAGSGLECSNCHMFTSPRVSDPIMGLVPTGHTFSVGSDACIACHQDTVHTRDELIKLSGNIPAADQVNQAALEQKIVEQEATIGKLEAQSESRLYVGLIQGAIIGLVTGGVAALVVSRGIRIVEVEDND